MQIVLICACLLVSVQSQSILPLSGQHLRIVIAEFPMAAMTKRNSSGHVIKADGVLIHAIEALSTMLHFTYTFLPGFRVSSFDDTPSGRGIKSSILNGDADFYLATFLPLAIRYPLMDYPASWHHGPCSTLVPYPEEVTNFLAPARPLSSDVWITLIITVMATLLYFTLVDRNVRDGTNRNVNAQSSSNGHSFNFVLGNLLSQGFDWPMKKVTVRIAAGAWCCGCFFLIQIYCNVLTSYLTLPTEKLLVNSFFDISKTPGVTLTIDRGSAIDVLFQSQTNSTHVRKLTSMLNENPYFRCNSTSKCLENVKTRSSAYAAPVTLLKSAIAQDFNRTGKCHYTMLKETFWSNHVFTVLPKRSPYMEHISRGVLRLKAAGLVDHWEGWYMPNTHGCVDIKRKNVRRQRLSIGHLSGAFIVLAFGCVLSVLVFLLETMTFSIKKRYNRAIGSLK